MHPLFAAIDAAIAEHGWPDDTQSLYVSGPSTLRDTLYCSVALHGHNAALNAHATTLGGAYTASVADAERRKALRADDEAREAARKLLEQAGLSPDLLTK